MKLCKRVPLTSKAMLLPFLREHFLASDPPHEVLATSFEYRAGEGVDLLALSPEGRLVAVLAHIEEPAAVVDDLLRRLHWIIENAPLVQRLFPAVDIDLTLPPRLALAVPRFDDRLRSVLRYFTATELAVYEYRLVEIDHEIALLVEMVGQFPHVAEPRRAVQTAPAGAADAEPEPPSEEAEAALDEVVTRQEAAPESLIDDDNIEIHVDDMNVADLGVSEDELLDLLNIHVPGRQPDMPRS